MPAVDRIRACLAGAALCLCAAPAMAAPPGSDGAVAVCNWSGAQIELALNYRDANSGNWDIKAWSQVPDGQCRRYGGIRTPSQVYYYAQRSDGEYWAGTDKDPRHCVSDDGTNTVASSNNCAAGERLLDFRPMVNLTGALYTYNVTNSGLPAGGLPIYPASTHFDTQSAFLYNQGAKCIGDYMKAAGEKAMWVGIVVHPDGSWTSYCDSSSGRHSLPEADRDARSTCEGRSDKPTCYPFARGDSYVGWADTEKGRAPH